MTEIISALHLEVWAEIGLVLFLLLFAGVLVYTFAAGNRATFARARVLPFDRPLDRDEEPADE